MYKVRDTSRNILRYGLKQRVPREIRLGKWNGQDMAGEHVWKKGESRRTSFVISMIPVRFDMKYGKYGSTRHQVAIVSASLELESQTKGQARKSWHTSFSNFAYQSPFPPIPPRSLRSSPHACVKAVLTGGGYLPSISKVRGGRRNQPKERKNERKKRGAIRSFSIPYLSNSHCPDS